MNKEIEVESFRSRYIERHQREKIRTNDAMRTINVLCFKDTFIERIQKSILPPSNSYMGRRFNIPKKSEALIKREIKVFSKNSGIRIIADIIFTAGPAIQSIISF